MFTNADRVRHLQDALTAFRSTTLSTKGILGDMPQGVDDDIWELCETFEATLEERIKDILEKEDLEATLK